MVTLRTSYPGIKKLVIVKSRWNATPAGRAALNAVAAYNAALATATTVGSIEPARRLASKSCIQCQADIKRIGGYIAAGQRVTRTNGRPNAWLATTLFVSSMTSDGYANVVFTGSGPAIELRAANQEILAKNSPGYIADDVIVDVKSARPVIDQIIPQ